MVVAATDEPSQVYIWNTFPTKNNQNYDFALTANGHFGTLRTITCNGSFLMIGDHNPKIDGPHVEGNFIWTSFPTSDVPHDFFMTAPLDPNFAWLQGDITDDTLLAVARYLNIWNTLPQSANQQPNLTVNFDFDGGDYADVAIAGGKVFISGQNASRVFVFNKMPTQPDQQPDFVLGSGDINTNPLVTNYFISNPVPVSNGQSLFVTSDFSRQLFVWRQIPNTSGTPYDLKITLPEAPWDNALKGDTLVAGGKKSVYIWTTLPLDGHQPDITYNNNIGNVSFQNIMGVALDDLKPFNPKERIIEFLLEEPGKKLADMSLTGFANETASESPAPGGGSISAYVGTLGVSLGTMVANLSAHKRGWDDRWEDFSGWAEKGQYFKDKLLRLVDEDTLAFNKIMNAFGLPKKTAEDKKIRQEAIQEASKYAMEIPFKVMETAYNSIAVMRAMAENGNPNSASDAGVGALCALTAVEGAYLNVKINAMGVIDKEFTADMLHRAEEIAQKARGCRELVLETVEKKINSL